MDNASQHTPDEKVQLAVFDFDGTCIDINSPVYLVHFLAFDGRLKASTCAKIAIWALKYKLKLPQDEAGVRALVFEGMQGMSVEEADAYMLDFYEKKLAKRIRKKAIKRMKWHKQRGDVVMIISATWETVIKRAQQDFPFDYYSSTRMIVKEGSYSTRVDGEPCEGMAKVRATEKLADKLFGKGNWEIAYAYGDHHSDRFILDAAKHPFAVTPSRTLTSYARKRGYQILDWSTKSE